MTLIKSNNRPVASISLDLDDKWTYLKSNGDESWKDYPSYLAWVVPRILDFFRENQILATFFIVGRDIEKSENLQVIHSIIEEGHELGNHSYNHDQWMSRYDYSNAKEEIEKGQQLIQDNFFIRPIGYRGPGFSYSDNIEKTLLENDYLYDASSWPTFIGPLSNLYFLLSSDFRNLDIEKRKGLFGDWKNGFKRNKPYILDRNNPKFWEIPVTTLPLLRLPFHTTYILFLCSLNEKLGLFYYRIGILLCRLTFTNPSILFHPPDFIGNDDGEGLSFLPAMKMKWSQKKRIMEKMIKILTQYYSPIHMRLQYELIKQKK